MVIPAIDRIVPYSNPLVNGFMIKSLTLKPPSGQIEKEAALGIIFPN
jgi:hypothetical protein